IDQRTDGRGGRSARAGFVHARARTPPRDGRRRGGSPDGDGGRNPGGGSAGEGKGANEGQGEGKGASESQSEGESQSAGEGQTQGEGEGKSACESESQSAHESEGQSAETRAGTAPGCAEKRQVEDRGEQTKKEGQITALGTPVQACYRARRMITVGCA